MTFDELNVPTDDLGTAPETTPARRTRRSRRVTRTVVVGEAVAQSPVETAQVPVVAVQNTAPADEAVSAAEAETADEAEAMVEQDDVEASPVVTPPTAPTRPAMTTLVFQAPQLDVRPVRRRARAEAGAPETISESARRSGLTEAIDALVRSTDEEPEVVDETVNETAESETETPSGRRRRRRSGRRRTKDRTEETVVVEAVVPEPQESVVLDAEASEDGAEGSSRRRRRRRRSRSDSEEIKPADEVTGLRGSTRLEAKRQRRRDGREAGRRRQVITEAEFLARRESVERRMVVRELHGRTQIAVLEDGILVEHYVSNQAQASMVGNVYLGRVQNVLPSMEAAFVDVGKGRNAVLYAGEVNWDAAGLDGQPRRIEQALKSGDPVMVQVTKDPIGHKGARLTGQVTLAGRYLVLVPGGGMTGISHKLPDPERLRLKKILRGLVPDQVGVIVRTAAEGASETELAADIERLQQQWEQIKAKSATVTSPALLQGEPDLAIRVVRDIFNDDFAALTVSGRESWSVISDYVDELAPDLAAKVTRWTSQQDVFAAYRIDEQLAKGMDRKVWLPSGGSLVIDRTEAMTVIDVNTGKFTGSGGTLEETVTRNNLEAAEEIVRQLRLRDIGGMIVIDFIDMVLESNRDLVLRRLVEALGRDRTKHQVAEVTSLGLVQMTRKRVGQGLVEAFSETCDHCHGRGFVVHTDPIEHDLPEPVAEESEPARRGGKRKREAPALPVLPEEREAVKATLATIAAAAAHAHEPEDAPEGAEGGEVVPDVIPGYSVAIVSQEGGADVDVMAAVTQTVANESETLPGQV